MDPSPPHVGQRRFEIRDERVDVAIFGKVALQLMGIEVAIGTLADAPRDVDVQRQRWQLRETDALE
jgi:hypothetical protein